MTSPDKDNEEYFNALSRMKPRNHNPRVGGSNPSAATWDMTGHDGTFLVSRNGLRLI
jgi:hypothetical protein